MLLAKVDIKAKTFKSLKSGNVGYTLFFCKNVVFPAQAEYSYFFADFRLEIFLYYS